ncbi:hypothetical protein SAMN05421858_0897 [Haladaptatus litoreus]|uniref:Uncharacterized protein n=1 Tax=Haladaptatus litoreus TaxID=553468 RepID=A0A1N6WWQ9_9EURY|nr:hypothetical protein [Haladaptatus litoreus]SIQ94483.1 hypothetical protein SAMN05421858_0897 [Haladaptatus litoreus]
MASHTPDSRALSSTRRDDTLSVLVFASGLALLTRGAAGSFADAFPADGLFAVSGVQMGAVTVALSLLAFAVATVYASRGGSLLDCLVLASAPWVGLVLAIWEGIRSSSGSLFGLRSFALCLLSGAVFGSVAYLVGLGIPRLVGEHRTRP